MYTNNTMNQQTFSAEEMVNRGVERLKDLILRSQVRNLIVDKFASYYAMSNIELDKQLTEDIRKFEIEGLEIFADEAKNARMALRINNIKRLESYIKCIDNNFDEFYLFIKKNL